VDIINYIIRYDICEAVLVGLRAGLATKTILDLVEVYCSTNRHGFIIKMAITFISSEIYKHDEISTVARHKHSSQPNKLR